jgi:hypothetical protein
VYLFRDAVTKGGTTKLKVYSTSLPVTVADPTNLILGWTDLGEYEVVGLGPNVTSSLELLEMIIIPAGESVSFLIVQTDGGDDLIMGSDVSGLDNNLTDVNGVDYNETDVSTAAVDEHLEIEVNAEAVKARSAFTGVVHYNTCAPAQEGGRRKLDHRLDSSPDRIRNWDLSPGFDPYRLLPSPVSHMYMRS